MTSRFLVICASLLQDPDEGIATFLVCHDQVNIGGEVWEGANRGLGEEGDLVVEAASRTLRTYPVLGGHSFR